jgi:hypothetical protein
MFNLYHSKLYIRIAVQYKLKKQTITKQKQTKKSLTSIII